MSATHKTWAEGMRAVRSEAAGVVTVEIIRPVDRLPLMAEALGGSAEAAQHLRLAYQFSDRVRRSSLSKPMLCGCCPRSIRRAPFSVVLAIPHNDAAENVMVLGICERCGTEPAELLERSRQALDHIWPGVRPISVHPAAGHG